MGIALPKHRKRIARRLVLESARICRRRTLESSSRARSQKSLAPDDANVSQHREALFQQTSIGTEQQQ